LYCQFRVERFDWRERLRRIEHRLHAVLKSIFLAVEDFPAMRRAVQDLGRALRSRRGVQHNADSAKTKRLRRAAPPGRRSSITSVSSGSIPSATPSP